MEKIIKLAEEIKQISETAKEITENGQQMIENVKESTTIVKSNAPASGSIDENMGITFSQFTTSKALLWVIVAFTVLAFVGAVVVDVIWGKNVQYILGYAVSLFAPTVVGYNTKSYLENKQKYNQTVARFPEIKE